MGDETGARENGGAQALDARDSGINGDRIGHDQEPKKTRRKAEPRKEKGRVVMAEEAKSSQEVEEGEEADCKQTRAGGEVSWCSEYREPAQSESEWKSHEGSRGGA